MLIEKLQMLCILRMASAVFRFFAAKNLARPKIFYLFLKNRCFLLEKIKESVYNKKEKPIMQRQIFYKGGRICFFVQKKQKGIC